MDIAQKGREVATAAGAFLPALRQIANDFRADPKEAFSKLVAVLKDLWAMVVASGLIKMVMDRLKPAGERVAESADKTKESVTDVTDEAAPLLPAAI